MLLRILPMPWLVLVGSLLWVWSQQLEVCDCPHAAVFCLATISTGEAKVKAKTVAAVKRVENCILLSKDI